MMSDRAFLNAVLRTRLNFYIELCFRYLNPETDFITGHYIRAMAHQMEMSLKGDNRRVIISLPPRHLKSISVSVAFTTWALGHYPTLKIIGVSYSADLAEEFGRYCLKIMKSPWYKSAFPETRLDKSKSAPSEFHTTKGGFRIATSVGGTLTGKGGDIVVLDDPIKSNDAMSEVKRRNVQEWYANTLLSRLDNPKKGIIVLVSQRVHTDDLTGFLLEKDEGWKHLCLPAIATKKQKLELGNNVHHVRLPGSLLHADRIDEAGLQGIKNSIGSHVFEAQYQQSPAVPGGTLIKLKWFKHQKEMPPLHHYSMVVQSWDTAVEVGEQNDFSTCTTWGVSSSGYYLLDVFRDRLIYPDLKKAVLVQKNKFKADLVVIEKANNGAALYQDFWDPKNRWIDCVSPREDKITRATHVLPKIEQGHVHIPDNADWLQIFEKEISEFPFGKFDDQVDSMTQFLYVTKQPVFYRRMARDYGFRAV
jgi:predicted phage terminase large subunit-like protein